jgi:PAS domain S-box-containing protein
MTDSPTRSEAGGVNSRLVESEERYRAVIENASDMIQSVRPDGTFEFVNRAWRDTLGYTDEEVGDMILWDIVHPDELEHCQIAFARAIDGETIEYVRTAFITKDRRKVPVEGSATSRFVDDKVIATHSFFRDISERLRAEELEERNAELERERVARYLEKMAALGKLAAGLAHELNNPAAAAQRAAAQLSESARRLEAALAELHRLALRAEQWDVLNGYRAGSSRPATGERRPTEVSRLEDEMEGWLEAHGVERAWDLAAALVQEGIELSQLDTLASRLPAPALRPALAWLAESSTTDELTNIVMRGTERISSLVSAVKAYSFMDRAAEQIVDVHDGIESTLLILAYGLRGLTVHRDYDRSLPPVRAFGSGLNQVWTNILDNAADALDGKGTITIRTRGASGRVVVEIEDDGPGIAAENLSRVFEPFFSTKAQGEGTGLGLDSVWRIITEEHGGTVEVESRPGRTLFRVSLPAAPQA